MQLSFGNLMKNRTFPKKTLPRVYFTSHFPFCSISIATTAAAPGRRNRDRQKIHVPLPFSLTAPLAGNHNAAQPQPSRWAWHYCAVAARGVEAAGRPPKIVMQIKPEPMVWFLVSLTAAEVLEAGTQCPPSSHHPPNVSHALSLSLPTKASRHHTPLPHTQGKMTATPETGTFEVFHFPLKKGTQIFFFLFPSAVVVDGRLTFAQMKRQIINSFSQGISS